MIETLAWMLALPPSAAMLMFATEVLLGLPQLSRQVVTSSCSYAIIVPAHNEEASIADTVTALLAANEPHGRLLVVADNCTDATYAIAEKAGAEAISRSDPAKCGKGFALAFGRDYLAQRPPEVVVVIDADCSMSAESLQALVAAAYHSHKPVQATDLLTAPLDAPPFVQISNFAMLVKNLVRARGLMRLGGGIPLFGTGMAFPWSLFERAQLATSEVVEDLHLAIQFAREGIKVSLIEQARVLSPSAAVGALLDQRRRWEHGFMRVALKSALPLLIDGMFELSRHRVALALHLCVPPFALLLFMGGLCALVLVAAAAYTQNWGPAVLALSSLAIAVCAIVAAWAKEGRDILSANALARAPIYVLCKLPMYGKFFTSRQSGWNRTRRPGEPR